MWFPRSLTPEDDEPTLAGLVGFEVIANGQEARGTQQGTIGRIAAIDDSTANLLFELEDGTLIPANDDLIEDINMEGKKITMNIPEGLLDI